MIELAIFNGSRRMIPMTIDGITLEQSRQGSPSKLTFTVIKDDNISFNEGAVARLIVDDIPVFKGFIFDKNRSKKQHISCVAYDQLRYFKNKDTFKVKNMKASDFIKFVSDKFFLKTGDIEDSEFVIDNLLLDNKSIIDAVQDTLDLTMMNTGKMFCLFDNFGNISLKDVDNMKSNLLICNDTAEDFSYKSSIEELCNVVKIHQKKSGSDVGIETFKINEESVKKYGALQHFENNLSEGANPDMIASRIMEIKNRVHRSLSISGALGDPTIRGGSSVYIDLDLGDQNARILSIVDSVKHSFYNDNHTMDLQINGKDIR